MSRKICAVFFLLAALALSPSSACQKCKSTLVCNPNCEIQEDCVANSFGQRGYECTATSYGCELGAPCFWTDVSPSQGEPEALASLLGWSGLACSGRS